MAKKRKTPKPALPESELHLTEQTEHAENYAIWLKSQSAFEMLGPRGNRVWRLFATPEAAEQYLKQNNHLAQYSPKITSVELVSVVGMEPDNEPACEPNGN